MKLHLLPAFALALSGLVACDRKTVVVEVPTTPVAEPVAKTKTIETAKLGAAVDTFEREPTTAHQADVKKALADLDGEIAELEALVAKRTGSEQEEVAAKLKNLQTYRAGEVARFGVAQAKNPLP